MKFRALLKKLRRRKIKSEPALLNAPKHHTNHPTKAVR
jgi:hypothetical protein